MDVILSPVTLYRLSKFVVLHISSYYIEIIILYIHNLNKLVEEIGGHEITLKF